MTRKRVLFIGTASNYAARFTKEGCCSKVVNLRNINGTLRPLGASKKLYQPNSKGHILTYVHVCNNVQHHISYNGIEIYHEIDIDETGITSIGQLILVVNEKFSRIDSIGNTLIIICPSRVYYLLYSSKGYISLGELPPMPVITLHEKTYNINSIFVPIYSIPGRVEQFNDTVREGFTSCELGAYYKLRDQLHNNYYFVQPIVVRYALRLYDGSHILPSPPIILCRRNIELLNKKKYAFFNYIEADNMTYVTEYSVSLYASTLGICIESINLDKWKDIVTGIDIFASAEIPLLTDDLIQSSDYVKVEQNRYQFTYQAPTVNIGQIMQQARDESLFYKILSIEDLENIKEGYLYSIKPDTNPDFTIYQQRLTTDTADFNRMGAAQSLVYNNRLHLADITRTYYEGYPATLFHTDYSTKEETAEACIKTRLQFPDGGDNFVVWRGRIPHFTPLLSPMLSYPDSNAISMEIAIRYTGYEYRHTYLLTAIDNENRASFVQNELADIEIGAWERNEITADVTSDFPASSINIVRRYRNLMRVSEIDNPFFFPTELSYNISGGIITGIATTTAALSQGQYGEFPLYIFTDEGIWAMQNGSGEVCYARCTPINRERIGQNGCITTIENAIIYLSGKSLYMISGAESTQLMSLEEYPEMYFEKQLNELFPEIDNAGSDLTLLNAFFNGNITSGYLYNTQELVFCNNKYPYLWVLHMPTKHLYRRSCSYQQIVNGYNSLFAQDSDGIVFDISQENEEICSITLTTRPICFAPDTYARLREVSLRMYGYCKKLDIAIVAANEPENSFVPIYRGTVSGLSNGNYVVRLAAPPNKYYRIALHGYVSHSFYLDCVDLAADTVKNNRLR